MLFSAFSGYFILLGTLSCSCIAQATCLFFPEANILSEGKLNLSPAKAEAGHNKESEQRSATHEREHLLFLVF
jgi:hypothetical protein